MKHVRIVPFLFTLITFLAACDALPSPSVDGIVAHLQEAQQHPQAMHSVMEMTFTTPEGEEQHTVTEQWVKPGVGMRLEYQKGPKGLTGTVMVMNGHTLWVYQPDSNTYTEMEIPDVEAMQPSPQEMSAQMRQVITRMLETMEFSYLGTEEVAGRRAYKLSAAPKPGMAKKTPLGISGTVTLWVDTEQWQVVGMEGSLAGAGYLGWHLREIEYGVELADDLFTFTPPVGTQKVKMGRQMMTLEAARQAVDFPILVPKMVPEGFQLLGVQVMEASNMMRGAKGKVVMLMYQGGVSTLVINEMRLPEGMSEEGVQLEMPGAQTEEVEVRGNKGLLAQMGIGGRLLMWQEGELQISITGQVDKETLLQTAESLE